jgi:AMIN domain
VSVNRRGESFLKKGNKTCGPFILIIPLILVVLSGVPSLLQAEGRVEVTDVNYWSYPEYTRIVISLSGNADFTQKRLSDPDRLYFDITHSMIKEELKTPQPVGNGMLKSIRAGQFDPDTVRIVLDLGKIRDYKITDQDPEKIVVDIYGKAAFSLKKRIVIDPGHGGHDPGAIGPNQQEDPFPGPQSRGIYYEGHGCIPEIGGADRYREQQECRPFRLDPCQCEHEEDRQGYRNVSPQLDQ